MRGESTPLRISAINLVEVVDVLTRIFESPLDEVLTTIAMLESGALEVVPVDRSIGVRAGELHGRHRARGTSPHFWLETHRWVYGAAAAALGATAAAVGEPLATSDEPLARAASAENVATILLPDSRGRRPSGTRGEHRSP